MDKAVSSNVFELPVRVYYEDTDAAGIVFYANYLKFAERARTELLRKFGIENSGVSSRDGTAFAVRSCNIEYLRPAHLDDMLTIETRITEIGGASMTMTQDVIRDGQMLNQMTVRLVCMYIEGESQGKATRIPADVRKVLEDFSGLTSAR